MSRAIIAVVVATIDAFGDARTAFLNTWHQSYRALSDDGGTVRDPSEGRGAMKEWDA